MNFTLNQIINSQKIYKNNNLNTIKIVDNLFNELEKREKNILIRRYGLDGKNKETLETIGQIYGLTRERIRQIEIFSIKKLEKIKELESHISYLRKIINQFLVDHGGFMEKNYLFELFSLLFINNSDREQTLKNIHKNHLNFLISKLFSNDFESINNLTHSYFEKSYKLKNKSLNHLEELVEELYQKIKKSNKIFKTKEIFNFIVKLNKYNEHRKKININNNTHTSNILKNNYFNKKNNIVNSNKTIYSMLKASKNIKQNKFGHWGIHNSKKIRPKTINDKIYLILKYSSNKPMHFVEIADKINEICFDIKIANSATVHNELILDNKYILVGRGLYALKEKGFKKGTVIDVITQILIYEKKQLTRKEIIKKVLKKRIVKNATIILALMDKNKFEYKDNKYSIKY